MTTDSDSKPHINLPLCPVYGHGITFYLNLACMVHARPHCVCVSCMLCKQSAEVVERMRDEVRCFPEDEKCHLWLL